MNSNTTLVKVKCQAILSFSDACSIQIQHLLKLNYIVHINIYYFFFYSNTTLVKVKSEFILKMILAIKYSNTTLVKVK